MNKGDLFVCFDSNSMHFLGKNPVQLSSRAIRGAFAVFRLITAISIGKFLLK
jgi:hypothetical protein